MTALTRKKYIYKKLKEGNKPFLNLFFLFTTGSSNAHLSF